ncbi:hypothetical protein GCM10011415_37680 [Salipiger pallidus]|uniref:Uncharacterized protein n=1 Tax=Salipiger pallidus TaxID=1775170 RepID=A0A8J3EJ03_9RHOB|nr:hypothetical protein [Salipiger pallidus]GGG84089.1 hypothetical protein GCM10011415_37680 [Salipiger pallidus]
MTMRTAPVVQLLRHREAQLERLETALLQARREVADAGVEADAQRALVSAAEAALPSRMAAILSEAGRLRHASDQFAAFRLAMIREKRAEADARRDLESAEARLSAAEERQALLSDHGLEAQRRVEALRELLRLENRRKSQRAEIRAEDDAPPRPAAMPAWLGDALA